MSEFISILSVISDVYTDQRVLRTASVFKELNYEVLIIGRKKNDSTIRQTNFNIIHLNPFFKKTILMYACFNLLLFFKLFFYSIKYRKNILVLYANDLDTLIPNYLIAKFFKLPLIYDSHEIFTEVPELQNKPVRKRIWEFVEKIIIPELPFAITVNESIANWYQNKYKIKFYSIRNISSVSKYDKNKTRKDLQLPENKKIIIIQGTGINIHRGAEELVSAMQCLTDDYLLLIIGSGDVINTLKQMIEKLKLNKKVIIKDRMPADELYHYTYNSDIGVSIDKPNNLNYLYSLPNKIFSYIYAHIPILSSRLPEIEKIITTYQIGTFIDNHHPQHIASKIEEAIHHTLYPEWKKNTCKASEELSWDKEKQILKNIIAKHINH